MIRIDKKLRDHVIRACKILGEDYEELQLKWHKDYLIETYEKVIQKNNQKQNEREKEM